MCADRALSRSSISHLHTWRAIWPPPHRGQIETWFPLFNSMNKTPFNFYISVYKPLQAAISPTTFHPLLEEISLATDGSAQTDSKLPSMTHTSSKPKWQLILDVVLTPKSWLALIIILSHHYVKKILIHSKFSIVLNETELTVLNVCQMVRIIGCSSPLGKEPLRTEGNSLSVHVVLDKMSFSQLFSRGFVCLSLSLILSSLPFFLEHICITCLKKICFSPNKVFKIITSSTLPPILVITSNTFNSLCSDHSITN